MYPIVANKTRFSFITLIAACLTLGNMSAVAAEKDDEKQEPKTGMLSGVGTLVEETHGKVSERFSRFIVEIDDFIGAGETGEQLNTSWARVRVDTIKPGAESVKLAATVKLRIVLPQSQKRFRLLVSSEDDASSAANSDAAQREAIAADDNNDVALALRFIKTAQDRFRLNYDLGVRYKDDAVQLFGRFIVGYKKDARFGFVNTYTNSFTYFSESGYQNNFRIDSRRTFFDKENLFFRNTLEFSGRKGNKGIGVGETIGFYADLGKRRAIALEGITGFTTALNEGATDRFRGFEARIRYRQNVWRPWLYLEFWPSVSWSSSNDYEKAYGGLFRVEVTLGKI